MQSRELRGAVIGMAACWLGGCAVAVPTREVVYDQPAYVVEEPAYVYPRYEVDHQIVIHDDDRRTRVRERRYRPRHERVVKQDRRDDHGRRDDRDHDHDDR